MDVLGHPKRVTDARTLHFTAALGCGALIGLATHLVLAALGWGLNSAWSEPSPPPSSTLHAAVAWWLIAGAAFVTGFMVGRIASGRLRLWHRSRVLRRTAALGFLIVLAGVAQISGPLAAIGPGTTLGVNLTAAVLSTVMALLGASLGTRPDTANSLLK